MIKYFSIPVAVFLAAWLGSSLTTPNLVWYYTLNLPSFTPSGGVIGAVWTILFILIALSWVAYRRSAKSANDDPRILPLYLLNLVLNVGWSYLFFYSRSIGGAFVEIWFLNLSIALLIFLLWQHHRASSFLLIPYFAWVSFATYLNYLILIAN